MKPFHYHEIQMNIFVVENWQGSQRQFVILGKKDRALDELMKYLVDNDIGISEIKDKGTTGIKVHRKSGIKTYKVYDYEEFIRNKNK
ncbi:TPA: hypothetical protein OW056_002713 [Staphylococcus aureus]|nr:hypothetical protein [Staphylococcus aureus]HCW0039235.1 hypothetical protein [Staphylococcus aureus]